MNRRVILMLVATLALGACSGGDAVKPLELQITKIVQDMVAARIAGRAGGKAARPPLTRAALDTLDGAFLEVTLERRDQLAYLYVAARQRDEDPGQITTWRTDDNITLALRNGIVVATRGLGGDLLSSTVQVAGDSPGPARGGEKVLSLRALDNKAVTLALACDLSDLGPVTIEIVGARHATRRLRETCEGGVAGDARARGQVVNDYWVDTRSGLVWQSRQWAGPEIGYLRLRQLTR